jgi:hypothetical protein
MTAPPAELCDHHWGGARRAYCPAWRGVRGHRCAEPAGHDDPQPPVHRCRCGATTTTTREDTR